MLFQHEDQFYSQRGFSLMEILVAIAMFAIITSGIFLTYGNILEVINRSRSRAIGTTILNEQIEIIRNLQYDDIGIAGGFPAGVIPYQKSIVREGGLYLVTAFVRSIDDDYDGQVGGSPNDTAPADYRLVELEVSCPDCFAFAPMRFTTWFAPENLEASAPNGSLFINVFDANGQPVGQADIEITNTSLNPTITIVDTSNNSGTLQLVDVPTSTNGYEITVTKDGYSSDQTYVPGGAGNPNPLKPHSTVVFQEITEISFAIDQLSNLQVETYDDFCSPIGGISFDVVGNRLIGSGPDVPKYEDSFTTDSGGQFSVSAIPWDTYIFTNTSSSAYDIVGSNPLVPVPVNPGSTTPVAFVLQPAAATSLVIRVVDESGDGLTNATVNLVKGAFNETKLTGERYREETNWFGGQYAAQDGTVDDTTAGQLTIIQTLPGVYATNTNSWLISNTFDLGVQTTEFFGLQWSAVTPLPPGSSYSFQLASNNDQATWNFIGPDGTTGTSYTTSPAPIGNWHDGNRYFRYRLALNTTNQTGTPTIQDVGFRFRSGCTPGSQAFWDGLSAGSYVVTVTKSGYNIATSTIVVGSGWQEKVINLIVP